MAYMNNKGDKIESLNTAISNDNVVAIIRLNDVTTVTSPRINPRARSRRRRSLAIRPLESRDTKLHEILRTNEPEDHPHEKRESSPRGVMHDGWFAKLIQHAAGLKLALTRS